MLDPKSATPSEIVKYLDEYIIGQKEAKKIIALALRTRYRRMKLDREMQEEITPKNILMIGSTGVGKTEIARRLAKIMNFPFIKVEASKYTEVGFVGRDVESMVRDLVSYSYNMVKQQFEKDNSKKIEEYILEKILDKLVPPPHQLSSISEEEYIDSRNKMREKVISGEMDSKKIKIEISKNPNFNINGDIGDRGIGIIEIQEHFSSMFDMLGGKKEVREVTIKEAKELLRVEALNTILDKKEIKAEAIRKAQEEGIIFIDEIDKIAVGSKNGNRSDPSKEGVQRDLLPIVEGSSVNTKYGQVKTDHILFIAAGAFHLSKPSDLIPELQGRFPLRVELDNLNEETLYQILTKPKNSLLKQYQALLKVEGVTLEFEDEAIRTIAKISQKANEKTEDIGARRLHTVIEKVVEDISFEAEKYIDEVVTITPAMVEEKLNEFIENEDIAHYIL
ncbi:MAG TPA: HslU--HslV peptidase ATPase subunit [Campylobacterales bacterium]|nr:HslU--HslV peptidase ATPase subunit [Campylobacterales bacterium]